jgi:hypothetical protein
MTGEVMVHERPQLDQPAMIVMLQGWIDASGAAAATMAVLEAETRARTIATFDRDTFIDYRARRPTMELREGVNTRLVWPGIELKAGRDGAGNDVLLLTGYEPDAAWERFADAATELAVELGTRMVVGVGAYPFASPHTRPPRLSTSSADAALANSVGYLRNSVDVPAGMEAVLEHTFARKGVPALGLWVQVPHYVATMSFPAATVALLNGLQNVAGVSVEGSEVRGEALIQRQRLDELVVGNDEHVTMVEQLERAYDAQEASASSEQGGAGAGDSATSIDPNSLPSGDELAAELERFLRDQGE